jgi:hypothetical protein
MTYDSYITFTYKPGINKSLNHTHRTVEQSKGKEITAQLKIIKFMTLTQLLYHFPANGMAFQ